MDMTNKEYNKYVSEKAKPSPIWKNMAWAFVVGGLICTLGQGLLNFYQWMGLSEDDAGTAVSMTLIFAAALLTGLGVFDELAKRAGAGTLVPITGFANSVAAPAIEYKKEGQVFGIGCKIFTISGPVILYGICTSSLLGLLYWIWMQF